MPRHVRGAQELFEVDVTRVLGRRVAGEAVLLKQRLNVALEDVLRPQRAHRTSHDQQKLQHHFSRFYSLHPPHQAPIPNVNIQACTTADSGLWSNSNAVEIIG